MFIGFAMRLRFLRYRWFQPRHAAVPALFGQQSIRCIGDVRLRRVLLRAEPSTTENAKAMPAAAHGLLEEALGCVIQRRRVEAELRRGSPMTPIADSVA